jgi:hypothetical protein
MCHEFVGNSSGRSSPHEFPWPKIFWLRESSGCWGKVEVSAREVAGCRETADRYFAPRELLGLLDAEQIDAEIPGAFLRHSPAKRITTDPGHRGSHCGRRFLRSCESPTHLRRLRPSRNRKRGVARFLFAGLCLKKTHLESWSPSSTESVDRPFTHAESGISDYFRHASADFCPRFAARFRR